MPSAILAQLDTFGPDRCDALGPDAAQRYTRELVRSHYENFSVVSRLLPAGLRDDFANVYAFCRWADDLGDETGDAARSLQLLEWWRSELSRCYAGASRHPVFVALRGTIDRHGIPREPFDHLIDAFVQDQTVTRYRTWDEVLDYCTRSANPVGRLVLYMIGCRDEDRQRRSDATCTALQLANFWQDARRDIVERGRVYIPGEVAARHGLDVAAMVKAVEVDEAARRERESCGSCCAAADRPGAGVAAVLPAYRATVRELVERTWPLFEEGRTLWPLVEPRYRPQLKLFTYGGESILRMIERQGYDTLTRRPSLGKPAKLALMLRALVATLWPRGGREPAPV